MLAGLIGNMTGLSLSVQLLLLLAVLVIAAKVCGAGARLLGQPAVFGELVAGVLLGPALLHITALPVFSQRAALSPVISALASLGAIVLMFLAGLETDLTMFRRVGKVAVVGAAGGVLLPLLGGYALASAFGFSAYHAWFVGAVLTATSVSISAQTLSELGQLNSPEGAAIMGAAVVDDVLGILVLSLIVALHGGGPQVGAATWLVLVKAVVFMAVATGAGIYLLPPLLRRAARLPGAEAGLALLLATALVFAFLAEALGSIAAITGAYLAGVFVGRHPDLVKRYRPQVAAITHALLAPIFLVSIGLQSDPLQLLRTQPLLAGALLVVAVVTKVIGAGIGSRLGGFRPLPALRVGVGMVSRGEVALVIAAIGRDSGVLSDELFSAAVLVSLATSVITPLLMRLVFPAPDAESLPVAVAAGD